MARESKKNLILATATLLFAEKGYNATGMEEIASKSEIPKSLIYYHFKNKEDVLNTIITDFINEYEQILNNDAIKGIEKISVYIAFLKQNRNCAKIMISESLKADNSTLFFKVLAPLMESDAGRTSDVKTDNAHWVAEFFTSIVPSLLFVCYEDSWCDYFGVAPKQLEHDFFNAYKLTHGSYHTYINKESL